DPEVLAVEVELAVLPGGLEDRAVLAQVLERPLEGNAEHPLDAGAVAGAGAEPEAARRQRRHDERLLDERERVAREGRHDRGPELDAAGLDRRSREDRPRV